MEMDQGEDGKSGAFRERNSRKFQKTALEKDGGNRQESRKALPEEGSVRLFISIGRGRRVFPREILGLIASKTSVSKDDIGAIRIFDNYSFIQVRTTAADEIIETLNGKTFRGRSLVVNYARTRKDDAEARPAEEGADGPGFSAEAGRNGDTAFFPEDGDYQEEEPGGEEKGDRSLAQQDDDRPDKEGI